MAKFSSGLRSAMLSQGSLKSLIDGHVLRIYEGEVPISADSALGNAVLLMELTVNGGGGGFTFDAGPGDITLRQNVSERWETLSVTASGAMSFFRLVHPDDSGSNDSDSLRIQGSIGRSFGHDMAVSTLNTLVGHPSLEDRHGAVCSAPGGCLMLFHQLLRACSKPLPVSIVGVVSLPLQNSDAERSITLTGHQSGDLLIAMIANQKDLVSPVPLPAPWTSILTAENDRLLRLSYKIATAGSDTISWLGNCGYLLALRNASAIGIFNTYAFGTSSSTQPIPALSGLDTSGTSLVLAGGRHSSTIAAVAPFQLLYPPETPANACAVFVPENTASDLSGKTFTTQRPSLRSNYAIEILG